MLFFIFWIILIFMMSSVTTLGELKLGEKILWRIIICRLYSAIFCSFKYCIHPTLDNFPRSRWLNLAFYHQFKMYFNVFIWLTIPCPLLSFSQFKHLFFTGSIDTLNQSLCNLVTFSIQSQFIFLCYIFLPKSFSSYLVIFFSFFRPGQWGSYVPPFPLHSFLETTQQVLVWGCWQFLTFTKTMFHH